MEMERKGASEVGDRIISFASMHSRMRSCSVAVMHLTNSAKVFLVLLSLLSEL